MIPALLLAALPATMEPEDRPWCEPLFETMAAAILAERGEESRFMGWTGDLMVVVFTNEETDTFTLVDVFEDGSACMNGYGVGWTPLPLPAPADDERKVP